jgi:aminopeptidase N
MEQVQIRRILIGLVLFGLCATAYSQARRAPSAQPRIDVINYDLKATLTPDSHELKAAAAITFQPLAATDVVIFEISENLSIQKVLDPGGIELEFGQDETGPGQLAVRFSRPLPAGQSYTIKVEYSGGFDRDRYSRLYTRDESNAYIGMEGSYLLYAAKWFPVNKYMVDRATSTVEINVPLGYTVIGPGNQLPVVTRGITETFGWRSDKPILPNSVIIGRYFEKSVEAEGFTIDCFAREDHIEAMQKIAGSAAGILSVYQKLFGPSAAGSKFRLVEVDDRVTNHPGSVGTIYITSRDLSLPNPPERQLARKTAYQWWMETVGIQNTEDLWLVDGLAYYAAALYLEQHSGAEAFKEEINNLAVLGLRFEARSAVRGGLGLGYLSEGYESVVAGKGAWVQNMLRNIVGDVKYRQTLQQYVIEYAGKGGTTSGFQKISEKVFGKELGWFFAEWIDTIGIPTLKSDYVVYRTPSGFRISGAIKQDKDLFRMPVEVEVQTRSKSERAIVEVNGKSTPFDIDAFSLPKQVIIDPDSKILRDSQELQTAVQLSLGNDLKQRGDFVESIRAYEKALQINPHKSIVHYRLAEVFYDQFNLQSAANSFRDALNGDKDPKWIETWCYIYLGKIYDILNQRQRALAEYNKALNTKDDTNGALAEAKKWIEAPFTRERTTMGDEKQPQQ